MSDSDLYTPEEAARYLNMSVEALAYHRRRGHVQGRRVGNNFVFTKAQLDAFSREPEKRGPKPRKKSPQAGGEGEAPSV